MKFFGGKKRRRTRNNNGATQKRHGTANKNARRIRRHIRQHHNPDTRHNRKKERGVKKMELNPPCRCGCKTGEIIPTPNTVHYAKIVCWSCRGFIRWQSAPRNENERPPLTTPEHVCRFHNLKETFCFFCGRKKEQLGAHETLTVDHILKREEGGADEVYNYQTLCSACHKLKHWAELYMRKHFNGEVL